MAEEYQSSYTGEEIDAGIGKANTAVQPSALATKQDKLVSGTNIKTINNESILGSGNINIQGGGASIRVIDANNPEDWDSHSDMPSQAALEDVISHEYQLVYIVNMPVDNSISASYGVNLLLNVKIDSDDYRARAYIQFDSGDDDDDKKESSPSRASIQEFLFEKQGSNPVELEVDSYELGGGGDTPTESDIYFKRCSMLGDGNEFELYSDDLYKITQAINNNKEIILNAGDASYNTPRYFRIAGYPKNMDYLYDMDSPGDYYLPTFTAITSYGDYYAEFDRVEYGHAIYRIFEGSKRYTPNSIDTYTNTIYFESDDVEDIFYRKMGKITVNIEPGSNDGKWINFRKVTEGLEDGKRSAIVYESDVIPDVTDTSTNKKQYTIKLVNDNNSINANFYESTVGEGGGSGDASLVQVTFSLAYDNFYNCNKSVWEIQNLLSNNITVIGKLTDAGYSYYYQISDSDISNNPKFCCVSYDNSNSNITFSSLEYESMYWRRSSTNINTGSLQGVSISRYWDTNNNDWSVWTSNYDNIANALNNNTPIFLKQERQLMDGDNQVYNTIIDTVLLSQVHKEEGIGTNVVYLEGQAWENDVLVKYHVTTNSNNDVSVTKDYFLNNSVYGVTSTLGYGASWNSNPPVSVQPNGSFSCTFYVNTSIANLSSVYVTMGGSDVTSTAYDGNDTISIADVTGNVEIIIYTTAISIVHHPMQYITTNISMDYEPSDIVNGESYITHLYPSTKAPSVEIQGVKVYMDGVDITSTAYTAPGDKESAKIEINSVTGPVVIIACAGDGSEQYTAYVNNDYGITWDNGSPNYETLQIGQQYSWTYSVDNGRIYNGQTVTMDGVDIANLGSTQGQISIPVAANDVFISVQTMATMRQITWNLTDISTSYQPAQVEDGGSFNAELYSKNGYNIVIDEMSMGGNSMISEWWDSSNNTINAYDVTDDVVITAHTEK